VPLLFLMIGNFQSTSYQNTGKAAKVYKGIFFSNVLEAFDQLANLIAEYPEIAALSNFVFVPGSNDPWAGNILPRPPIPSQFVSRLVSKVKNVHFPGNPCRIKYCTKEIVIMREDLMHLMRRNTVTQSDDGGSLEYHVKFI
jgi:DNA polymerase epsilon subunit 2